MVWKPIKGQEGLAGKPSELARRMLPAEARAVAAADLERRRSEQLHAEGISPLRLAAEGRSGMAVGLPGSGIGAGVPVGLGARMEAIEERLGQQELRIDRLEEAVAAFRIRSEAPVNEVAGKPGKTSFPVVSPAPEDAGEADRRKKW